MTIRYIVETETVYLERGCKVIKVEWNEDKVIIHYQRTVQH